jgi:hypothetical protein
MGRSKVSVGEVPEGATSGGAKNNEVDETVRNGATGAEVTDGPKMGDRGQYLPAAYPLGGGTTRIDR